MFLITGATGTLGSLITTRLHAQDMPLRCLVRRRNRVQEILAGIQLVEGELEDAPSLARACKGVDTIVHCAAVTHTNDEKIYYRVNYEGTKNLLAAAPKNLKHFLYVSTTALGEKAGAYGHSKYLAEETVKNSRFPNTIIRPSEVYDAPKQSMIEQLARLVKKLPVIPLVGDGNIRLAPVHVDDVVAAIVRAALLPPKNATYILAGPEQLTYTKLLQILCGARALKNRHFVPVPSLVWRIAAEASARLSIKFIYRDQISRLLAKKNYDISLAQKDLNYFPRKVEEGLLSMNSEQ